MLVSARSLILLVLFELLLHPLVVLFKFIYELLLF